MQTCSAERQTHTRPARRPPQHSHHSVLATSSMAARPLTNTHFPQRHQTPQVLIWSWDQKGTLGHHQLLCPAAPAAEGPDDGFTPETCPPATPTARIQSFPPAHSQAETLAWLCPWSARESPSHYCTSSQNTEPSSSCSSCQVSLAPTSAEQNPKVLCPSCVPEGICDQRFKDKVLPVASRMTQSMLGNYKRLQLCQCKPAYALLPSISKTSSMCCGIGPGWHSSVPPGLMSLLYTE